MTSRKVYSFQSIEKYISNNTKSLINNQKFSDVIVNAKGHK